MTSLSATQSQQIRLAIPAEPALVTAAGLHAGITAGERGVRYLPSLLDEGGHQVCLTSFLFLLWLSQE